LICVIMRGLPGSGKSTYAKKNYPDATVCSADNLFVNNGVYKYDASRINEAHQHCMRQFLVATMNRTPTVVVDNTNVSLWEASPYVAVAEARGYRVSFVRVDVSVEVAAARNTHGVTREKIEAMARRFEKSLPWWSELRVDGAK